MPVGAHHALVFVWDGVDPDPTGAAMLDWFAPHPFDHAGLPRHALGVVLEEEAHALAALALFGTSLGKSAIFDCSLTNKRLAFEEMGINVGGLEVG